jgi:hypothetical protein
MWSNYTYCGDVKRYMRICHALHIYLSVANQAAVVTGCTPKSFKPKRSFRGTDTPRPGMHGSTTLQGRGTKPNNSSHPQVADVR